MKICDLCGLENPDEARFCMKCGRDLDAIDSPESPFESDELDSWLPAAADEVRPSKPAIEENEPPGDLEFYKQAQHMEASSAVIDSPDDYGQETPEIQLTDVTADFTERRRMCSRCGASNPHDQRFCRSCGAPLNGDDKLVRVHRALKLRPQRSQPPFATRTRRLTYLIPMDR